MMRRQLIVMIAVLLAMTAVQSFGGDKSIAVVDMRAIMTAHPEIKVIESAIQKKLEEFKAEQVAYKEQMDKMASDLEQAHIDSENKALSEEARKMKKALVDGKVTEMKQFQVRMKETLRMRRDQIEEQGLRMQKKIVDQISASVKVYAKEKDISVVLNSQVVIYNKDAIDITNDIMELVVKSAKSE